VSAAGTSEPPTKTAVQRKRYRAPQYRPMLSSNNTIRARQLRAPVPLSLRLLRRTISAAIPDNSCRSSKRSGLRGARINSRPGIPAHLGECPQHMDFFVGHHTAATTRVVDDSGRVRPPATLTTGSRRVPRSYQIARDNDSFRFRSKVKQP